MAPMHDDDRERMPGPGGYGGRRAEEYGGRRGGRYGAPERDDEDRWQRDREGPAYDGGQRHGRDAMRSGPGWYGTRDYDRHALAGYGGRPHGSESMGGTVSMAGKGPKGYRRSDERIREDVCDSLTDDPDLDASAIEVKVKDGEVTLNGSVDSRNAKRLAEHLIDQVSGVRDVHNGLKVQEAASKRVGRAAGPS